MFHLPAHSPTKHGGHQRPAGMLRSASPRKKHAHRLGDDDIAPGAGPSGSRAQGHGLVPIKPSQRSTSKPTLGKTLDAPTAKALFGGHLKPGDASAGPSKLSKKQITTPPAHGPRAAALPTGLMTSPRRALGDKTNASPVRDAAAQQQAAGWTRTDSHVEHADGGDLEASVEQPLLKGILQSSALTDEELDMICAEVNSGEYERNPPRERPELFADLPPAAQSLSAEVRNIQAMLWNHFRQTEDDVLPYEPPSLALIMGESTGPAPSKAPQVARVSRLGGPVRAPPTSTATMKSAASSRTQLKPVSTIRTSSSTGPAAPVRRPAGPVSASASVAARRPPAPAKTRT